MRVRSSVLEPFKSYETGWNLADTFEDDELTSYFEATWIGGLVGWRQRRTPARFPAAMRNVVERRHFTGSTRKTNALEAFHHSFNSLVACQHPFIRVLLKSLQRQQALTDNMLGHIAQGETKLPGTREREREHAMLELLRLYLHTIDLIQKKLYEGLHLILTT